MLIKKLLVPEDRLYACPHKGCIVRLTDEQFVNHVRYHIRSTLNQGSEQYKCKYCTQTLLPPSLRTHLQQSHARHKLFCSICLATAANKRLMLYHVRNQHPQAFDLVNRQLQFIQLPTDADGGAAGKGGAADANEVFLAAVVQPFGKQEMEVFRRQLLAELQLRRLGLKTHYRGSEVRLLPRSAVFPQPLNCAECSFSTVVRCMLQKHLYDHKEKIVREAYQTEEETALEAFDAAVAVAVAASNETPPTGDAAPAETNPAATTQGDEAAAAAAESPRPPGKHKPVVPRFVYVPTERRYRCGFKDCLKLLPSELDLRQHMTIEHCYNEGIYCLHCNTRQPYQVGQTSVERYLGHLLLHKRHIYQCGVCVRYNNKLAMIERHIQDRHPLQEVDVVVHRHTDSQLTTTARWLKPRKTLTAAPPYPVKGGGGARPNQMEFICNLCQVSLPTPAQIMAHAVAVHDRKYQYHCPYCQVGDKEPSEVIEHILASHGGRRVQPVQIYQRIAFKKGQTLGFYCIVCQKAANSFQKIGQHCEERHKSRYQWQCPHCDFGHQQERIVGQHIDMTHPQRIGLAVMQFERVPNELPDSMAWEMGQPIEEEVVAASQEEEEEEQEEPAPKQAGGQQQPPKQAQQAQAQAQHIITEVVDLLGSDEEAEAHECGESQEELVSAQRLPEPNEPINPCPCPCPPQKIIEFACTHCGETNSNLQDLRTQHWAHVHPDQPFYFRVQPQLLCSECKRYKSNAKTLRDDHLLKVHSIRNIVACDVRRPEECAYCDYKYEDWRDLAHHICREGHLPNDLKNVTDAELAALQQLSASSENEYYQCDLCSVVMPTKGAIGQHGRVEHNKPGERFCFRQLTAPLIFHCFFCMFTSADELTTLRHMVDHYNRFLYCAFCARHLPGASMSTSSTATPSTATTCTASGRCTRTSTCASSS